MYTFAVILGYDPKVFGVAAAALPPSPGRKTLRAIVEPVTTKNRHISNHYTTYYHHFGENCRV